MVRHTLSRLLPAKLRDFIRTVKSRPHDKICSLRFTFLRDYFFGRLFVDLLYFPYDIHIIFQTYKHTFGRYPNIIRPATFNEYIQHSKIFRRKSLQTTFADKLAVRDYVKKRIGERHLVRLLWSGDDLHEGESMQLKVPLSLKQIIAREKLFSLLILGISIGMVSEPKRKTGSKTIGLLFVGNGNIV
jgi:hypothetical protein